MDSEVAALIYGTAGKYLKSVLASGDLENLKIAVDELLISQGPKNGRYLLVKRHLSQRRRGEENTPGPSFRASLREDTPPPEARPGAMQAIGPADVHVQAKKEGEAREGSARDPWD